MKHGTVKSDRDRLVIEAVVRRCGPLSRVDIHKLTHLQQSVISRLVRELLVEGRLAEKGRGENPMGRKQVLLHLNEDYGFIVGVGFNAENVIAATMNLRPEIKSLVKEPTRLDQGREGLIAQLLSCAQRAIKESGVEPKSLLGIGVAGSGIVNTREGMLIMSSTIEMLKQVPLQEIFEHEFGIPTLLENITRAKTVAERVLGAGNAVEDMIYMEYGAGIGAGIINGGKLLYGSGYAGGEFGHTHMMEEGPACKCGSFGCLEAVASCSGLETRIRKAIAEGANSQAMELAANDPSKISGWTVLKAASLGDKTCARIVEQIGNYLGVGLANLVNLFNPSMLILDERLSLAGDGLLDQITRVIRRQALNYSAKNLVVKFGTLGSEASVLGAGLVVLEKYFEIPALKPPRFMIEPVSTPFRREPVAQRGSLGFAMTSSDRPSPLTTSSLDVP
jgi:N-acetylglucosamine repressor